MFKSAPVSPATVDAAASVVTTTKPLRDDCDAATRSNGAPAVDGDGAVGAAVAPPLDADGAGGTTVASSLADRSILDAAATVFSPTALLRDDDAAAARSNTTALEAPIASTTADPLTFESGTSKIC